MSSSISSFKHEMPVWLAVALVFVAAELAFRAMGARVSDNLARTENIPKQAARLVEAESRPRVLILGNSLTIRGIDDKLLRREATAALGREPAIETIALFAADTTEWYWIVDQQFASPGKMPDTLVLNLDDDFVRDMGTVRARRLALYFPVFSQPFVPLEELPTFETQAEFVIAKLSQAYSRAKNLGTVALSRILPHGEAGSEWVRVRIAERRKEEAMSAAASSTEPPPMSYDRLERLLNLGKQSNARVVCVLMPHREPYDIPAEVRQRIAAAGASIVDARAVAGITVADFADEHHLNEQGAAKFTPEYARRLMAFVSSRPSASGSNSVSATPSTD